MLKLRSYYSKKIAPITKVLSQYELLQAVCSTLSGADIIHLAATCREHRTYITSSKEILALLQSTAHCDGRGIVAQARVFGYWNGDPTQAPEESRCLGADAKPCTSCGAHVCDNCRFHLSYDRSIMNHDERDFGEDVQDEGIDRKGIPGKPLPDLSIESGKAFDIFWNHRKRTFCDACEPLIIGLENESEICRCDFFEHFVGSQWPCLPCFFVEETKAHQCIDRRIVAFEPGAWSPFARLSYIGTELCNCGEFSRHKSTEACRVCKGVIGWFWDRKDDMLSKIYAQLG